MSPTKFHLVQKIIYDKRGIYADKMKITFQMNVPCNLKKVARVTSWLK